ncbi:hypothetical protein CAFE_25030 [Caprobacter fermentans]|uniref:Uncharacterized protein n=1 Tax=Caproicibacter fermentans TaxID=2576756 RepID=A0A6N8I1I4_9FIRM|nr:DUF6550 family protein [Caproicibacter fermentans]MVB11778.1 hypothetical protein [Caproicibacter fermentans]
MKLTYGTKRVLFIAGLAVICVGAVSLVVQHTASADGAQQVSSSESSAEIILGTPNPISVPPISSEESGTSSAFVPSSGAKASAPLTTVSKPTSAPPAPTPPASSELTNKAKKPTYSSKPTASSKKSTSSVTSKAPAGKSYMPGFGYVDGTGGGQGTKDDSMYENGVKVGIM